MFRIFLTNFGYYLDDEFSTLADAIDRAKRAGFEASIIQGGSIRASWSPLGGTRRF